VGRTLSPVALLALCALLGAAALSLTPGTGFARLLQPANHAQPELEAANSPVAAGRRPDGAWRARFPRHVARPRALGHLLASVRPGRSVELRARPGGPVVARLGARTEFGSSRTLSVVRTRHGRWLGVTTPELGNDRLGWVDARAGGLRFARTRLELEVDLSRRTLSVRSGRRLLRTMVVGVGRPGSSTPVGRFAVTDKLDGAAYSPAYGCCILALSGRQTNLPAGWRGGDRLAIHGGSTAGAVSAGCLHAGEADLRYLMRLVPVGTPLLVRR
jgi:L,D-transpeptidase catalytic domain